MPSTLIDAQQVSCRFGEHTVVSPIDLRIAAGDRIALVGENGSGKSTLLATLAGRREPDRGRVVRAGRVAYLPQLGRHGETGGHGMAADPRQGDPAKAPAGSSRSVEGAGPTPRSAAHDALGVTGPTVALAAAEVELARSGTPPATVIADHADRLEDWLAAGGPTVDVDLDTAADRLDLSPDVLDRPVRSLSSGQAVRAALLPIAARRHDVLLLDEPTNHLDRDGRSLLHELLDGHAGALVFASHDRTLLSEYADRVVELRPRGESAAHYAGGWTAFEREVAASAERARSAFELAVQERDELRRAEREIRRRAQASRSRVDRRPRDGDKHVKEWFRMRADGVDARAGTVAGRADRVVVPDKPWEERALALRLTPEERRSRHVVTLDGAVLRRGPWRSRAIDLTVELGDRIVLVGRNGSGKSTLLEALAGTVPLAAGRRIAGQGTVTSVLGAVETALHGDDPVVDIVARLLGTPASGARAPLAAAGVGAAAAARPASALSPGERTRAELAVLAARRTTCLLLDEPSNHLDLRSLQALETALDGWPGALVVATHDERFIEHLRPTRTLTL